MDILKEEKDDEMQDETLEIGKMRNKMRKSMVMAKVKMRKCPLISVKDAHPRIRKQQLIACQQLVKLLFSSKIGLEGRLQETL